MARTTPVTVEVCYDMPVGQATSKGFPHFRFAVTFREKAEKEPQQAIGTPGPMPVMPMTRFFFIRLHFFSLGAGGGAVVSAALSTIAAGCLVVPPRPLEKWLEFPARAGVAESMT